MCNFFLGFREFGPSNFFGPRRKVVLCEEDNTWTLVLRSFNKLREVGFHPTCFTLDLRAMLMFRLV